MGLLIDVEKIVRATVLSETSVDTCLGFIGESTVNGAHLKSLEV